MVGDKGTILHSVNDGVTWDRVAAPVTEDLFGVSFVSPTEGWVVGARGAVWHTKDEGVSWQFQHTNSLELARGRQVYRSFAWRRSWIGWHDPAHGRWW